MTSVAWDWTKKVRESGLDANTKLILLNLHCHMNRDGGSCFPSIECQMEMTSLSKPTVIKHLKLAVKAGFIAIVKRRLSGKRWALNEYVLQWPGRFEDDGVTPLRSREIGPEGGKAALPGDVPADADEVNLGAEGGKTEPSKVVKQLYPKSPETYPGKTPGAPISVGVSDSNTESCKEDSSSRDDVCHLGSREPALFEEAEVPAFDKGVMLDSWFDEKFWPEYPRKVGKKGARTAWHRAFKKFPNDRHQILQMVVLRDLILLGLATYIEVKPAYQDWKHPATWLNGECWDDEENPNGTPGVAKIDGLSHDEIMAHTFESSWRLTTAQKQYRQRQLDEIARAKDEEAARRFGQG